MDGIDLEKISKKRLQTLLKRGEIFRVARGIYGVAPISPEAVLDALYRRYPLVVLTGRTVAEVYLGRPLTFPVQVTAPHRLPASQFVQPYRQKSQPFRRPGAWKLHLPLAALKFVEDPELGRTMLEHVYRGRNGKERFHTDAAHVGRVPEATRLVVSSAALGTDSGAEVKLLRALLELGIPAVANYKVGPYFWDIAVTEWKVLIEIDSIAYHSSKAAFIRDRWKNNDAELRGWLTLRYSGSCIAYHLDQVVDQIRQARSPAGEALWRRPVWKWHHIFLRDDLYEESHLEGP